jgi:hypothetical protein
MFAKKLLSIGVAGALGLLCAPAFAGPVVNNNAVEIVGAGAAADPLIAVEANRAAIINRLVVEHSDTLAAAGTSQESFRKALNSLRADQLLAVSLVNSVAEIMAIVSQSPSNGTALQRFVALTPIEATSMSQVPSAEAYLVRDGETLTIVKASNLQLSSGAQLVGYFAPATSTVAISASTAAAFTPKDGSGSGTGSWIGYTSGGNQATGLNSAVAAGSNNLASAQGAFVGAGTANQANGLSSLVIGGFDNRAVGIDSLVGAGAGHRATGSRSVIVGGGYNLASGGWSFIGGGGRDGTASTAAGTNTLDNIASGNWSVVVGGKGNRAIADYAAVLGGASNTASGPNAIVAGGASNTASGSNSIIAGGIGNAASAIFSAVGGGSGNVASGFYGSTVAGGQNNQATASWATVPGGASNIASGYISFAAGYNNHADQNNCFVLGGWSNTSLISANCLGSSDIARLAFLRGISVEYYFPRADGGGQRWVHIGDTIAGQTIATWTGGFLTNSGVWTNASDRDLKDGFAPIDPREVLKRVAALPIQRWHYKVDGAQVTHLGPVAQDFHAAFGLGSSNKAIGTIDADGVALAAIQGVYAEVQERDARIALQQVRLETQTATLSSQQQRIAALEQQVGELAASQLQWQDLAAIVVTLHQEMAMLRQAREVVAKKP